MTNDSSMTRGVRGTLVRLFVCSAGVLVLFLASVLFLSNLTRPADLSPVNDPVLKVPLPWLFWVVGGLGTIVALTCLLHRRPTLPAWLVGGCALGYVGCRCFVSAFGICEGFGGYLGEVGGLFGLRGQTTDLVLVATCLYLLAGSSLSVYLERKQNALGVAQSE